MRPAFVIRVKGDRIRLRYRNATFRSAFSPLFYGVIESESSGARISGGFRIHPLARAFAWLWFSFVTVVGAVLLGASIRALLQGNSAGFEGQVWVGLIVGPGLILFGIALVRFGWSTHVHAIVHFLATTTEGRISSDGAA